MPKQYKYITQNDKTRRQRADKDVFCELYLWYIHKLSRRWLEHVTSRICHYPPLGCLTLFLLLIWHQI